jgi:kynurenine formamidase
MSFQTIDWIHDTEIAAIATDTWGAEVRPNEFPDAFQPWHQVVIPHLGLYVGEMFDLDPLAEACAADGNYDCLLVAAPLAVKGGVGAPVNPIAVR